MNWLTDLVVPVLKTAIWGFVVTRLGRYVVERLESSVSRTLDRLRRAGPAEFDPTTAPPQVTAGPPPTSPPLASLPETDLVLPEFEKIVRMTVTGKTPEEREAPLLRLAAYTQLIWLFEALNFTILGSQLALLHILNAQPLTVAQARSFYDLAAQRFPDYYRSYSFDAWLHWFLENARFGIRTEDKISISPLGREFLQYLIGRGYSMSRFG